MSRARLLWTAGGRSLSAIEPDAALVSVHASVLCGWYNAAENAAMMDGSGTMSTADVIEFWRELREDGGHGFLGFEGEELIGDADLRGLRTTEAGRVGEFAIMIGDPKAKGRGLGRTLATMIHVFAFRELGLVRIYVPPRRDNARVHALNAFLGYQRDESATAKTYADGPDCVTYSLDRETFRARHTEAWRSIVREDLHGDARS